MRWLRKVLILKVSNGHSINSSYNMLGFMVSNNKHVCTLTRQRALSLIMQYGAIYKSISRFRYDKFLLNSYYLFHGYKILLLNGFYIYIYIYIVV